MNFEPLNTNDYEIQKIFDCYSIICKNTGEEVFLNMFSGCYIMQKINNNLEKVFGVEIGCWSGVLGIDGGIYKQENNGWVKVFQLEFRENVINKPEDRVKKFINKIRSIR